MFKRRSQPVIPVPDRRRGKRIMTLKNFRNAVLAALALFGVVTIASEMRRPREGEYGRIVNRTLPKEAVAKPFEVVTESNPVREETSADPMLIEPAIRAQFLGDTTLQPVPVTTTELAVPATAPATGKVVVVGGPEGVAIVQKTERALPKLGGGFGK